MAVEFDEMTRKLLDGKNFPTVATINPDGGPQASVVWILRCDTEVPRFEWTHRLEARR